VVEAFQISEVLGDSPDELCAVDVGVVPLDELLSVFEVLCDGLFGEHVLACGKCTPDVVWLIEDGEAE